MHHEGDTTTVSAALLLIDSYSKSCIIMAYTAERVSSLWIFDLWLTICFRLLSRSDGNQRSERSCLLELSMKMSSSRGGIVTKAGFMNKTHRLPSTMTILWQIIHKLTGKVHPHCIIIDETSNGWVKPEWPDQSSANRAKQQIFYTMMIEAWELVS